MIVAAPRARLAHEQVRAMLSRTLAMGLGTSAEASSCSTSCVGCCIRGGTRVFDPLLRSSAVHFLFSTTGFDS